MIGQTEERFKSMTKDMEILRENELKTIMNVRDPVIYWGTAPTGIPSIAYLLPALRMRDVVNANCNLIVLIADLHAFLDGMKSSLDKISLRAEFYKKLTEALLERMNVDLNKVKFVKGTDFQLTENYTMDKYKIDAETNINQCKHAGAEVVKQNEDPLMISLEYPALQALDMVYLNADGFLCGVDQRKINTFAIDYLPKIGYDKKYSYLMTPMIGGLRTKKNTDPNTKSKMSSSEASSKISIIATPEEIRKGISKVYCLEADIIDNSLLELMENLIFKIVNEFPSVKYNYETKKYKPSKIYLSYEDLKNDLSIKASEGGLHPADFKESLILFLIDYLQPIRNKFDNPECKKLIFDAYDQ